MQNELQTAQIGCTEGRHGVVKAENFLVLLVFSRAHTKSSIAAVVLKKMKSVRVHLPPLHYRAMATLELLLSTPRLGAGGGLATALPQLVRG